MPTVADHPFIDDLVDALLRLAASAGTDGEVYNVGSGHGTRLVDMATLIVERAGGGQLQHVDWPEMAARVETGDFVADVQKVARDVGWRPLTGVDQGLRECLRRLTQNPGPEGAFPGRPAVEDSAGLGSL